MLAMMNFINGLNNAYRVIAERLQKQRYICPYSTDNAIAFMIRKCYSSTILNPKFYNRLKGWSRVWNLPLNLKNEMKEKRSKKK